MAEKALSKPVIFLILAVGKPIFLERSISILLRRLKENLRDGAVKARTHHPSRGMHTSAAPTSFAQAAAD